MTHYSALSQCLKWSIKYHPVILGGECFLKANTISSRERREVQKCESGYRVRIGSIARSARTQLSVLLRIRLRAELTPRSPSFANGTAASSLVNGFAHLLEASIASTLFLHLKVASGCPKIWNIVSDSLVKFHFFYLTRIQQLIQTNTSISRRH